MCSCMDKKRANSFLHGCVCVFLSSVWRPSLQRSAHCSLHLRYFTKDIGEDKVMLAVTDNDSNIVSSAGRYFKTVKYQATSLPRNHGLSQEMFEVNCGSNQTQRRQSKRLNRMERLKTLVSVVILPNTF